MSNTERSNYESFYNIAENLSRNGSDIKKYCVMCFKNECDVRLVSRESYYNMLKLLSISPIATLSQQALLCKICNYLLEKVSTFLEDLRTIIMVNDLVNSNPRLCMNVLESLATKTGVEKYSKLVVELIDKLNSQLNSLLARKLLTTKLLYGTTESEIWDTFETEDKKGKAMKSKRHHDVQVEEKFHVYGAHPKTEVTNDARSNLENETDEEICVKPVNNINRIKIYSDLLKEEFVNSFCNSYENFDDTKKECDDTKEVGDVKTEVDDDEDVQKDDIIDLDSIKESNDEFIDNERMIKEIVTKQPVVVLKKLLENDLVPKPKVNVPKSPPKPQIFMVRNSQLVPYYILGDVKDEVLNRIWNDDQIVQHVDQNNKNVDQTLPTIEQTGINVGHYKTKDKNTVNVGKVQNLATNVVKTVHNSQTAKSKAKSINLVKRSNSNDCVEISGNMDKTVNQEMDNIEEIPPISLVRDPKTSYKIRETPKVQSEVNNKRKFSDRNKNGVIPVIKVRKAIMDANKVVEGVVVVTEDDSFTYILPDVQEKKEDSTDFIEIVDDTNLSKTDGDVIVCDSDSDS